MSDKWYTVLAFIGFIILCVIYVFNVNPDRYINTFMVGDYYAPESVTSAQSAAEIYQDLSGGRKVSCPQTTLSMSENNIAYVTGMYILSEKNMYNNICFWLTFDSIDKPVVTISPSGYKSELSLNSDNIEKSQTQTMSSLVNGITGEYVEIIAPFKFLFDSVNTIDPTKISIMNSSGNCMLVFEDTANWFCAGPIGTESENNDGSTAVPEDWVNHQHNTVMGSSSNAVISGGQAGQVIGYATKDTKVSIYAKVNGSDEWTQISVKDWLLSGS